MSNLTRLFEILWVIGRYRLDQLIDKSLLPARYRLLLLPFSFFPPSKKSRGEKLRFAFETLGPIFVKFGQILSTRPDLIPYDIIQELNHLQDNVTPFETAEFKKLVELGLSRKIENVYAELEEHPLGSASVAQVHAAKLLNGTDVVVKVIRPNIEKTIVKDTQLLRAIANTAEKMSAQARRLRLVEVVEDYRTTVFDELDLTREAANASQLRRNFEDDPTLTIPEVYWDYCSRQVMTMERIYGINVNNRDALEAQNTNFALLAERGVTIFFKQVFEHNFFHADMHPGNVFVSHENPQSPSYMAVDFAIVGSLSKEDQFYLARNLIAMFRRDYRQVAELHVQSGWVPEHTSVNAFESAIRAVCEPIFEKPLKEISFGEALITLFQTAQRFEMPVQPQLVLLQKTLLNIEGLGRQLYPDLDLWQTAHPYLEKWIRDRYHPKTLWKNFKYHSPDWLEKFPQMPHLVFDALNEVKQQTEIKQALHDVKNNLSDSNLNSRKRQRKTLVAILAVIATISLVLPKAFLFPEVSFRY